MVAACLILRHLAGSDMRSSSIKEAEDAHTMMQEFMASGVLPSPCDNDATVEGGTPEEAGGGERERAKARAREQDRAREMETGTSRSAAIRRAAAAGGGLLLRENEKVL